MTCCICDDNVFHLKHLTSLVKNYINDSEWLCESFSDPQALIQFLRGEKAQLIIMDVDLGDENGIECIKEIHSFQPGIIVIFVSANIEFCSSVYVVDHVYFLPKPIREPVFNDALQKALTQIKLQQNKTIIIKNKNMVSRVMLDEIIYIESDRRKIVFHTLQGLIETYGSLETLFEALDKRFIHCHKSFVVNMDFVRHYESNAFQLTNKEIVPISQLKRNSAKTAFLNYLGDKL